MTDSTVWRLERDIRDTLAFRAACDPPRTEDAQWLMQRIEDAEPLIRADDALRLRTLVRRLSGVKE